MQDTDLIATDAAAKALHVDRATITRWAVSGKLTPVLKAPGTRGAYWFERSQIEKVKAERAA